MDQRREKDQRKGIWNSLKYSAKRIFRKNHKSCENLPKSVTQDCNNNNRQNYPYYCDLSSLYEIKSQASQEMLSNAALEERFVLDKPGRIDCLELNDLLSEGKEL